MSRLAIHTAVGDDDGRYANDLPRDGWTINLWRNTVLGELVGQIPQSDVIKLPNQSNARDNKEWHMIVHDIAPVLDEQCQRLGLQPGDRVVISGSATNCYANGRLFHIVPFNAIQAVLRHESGPWAGSIYGKDAVAKPSSSKDTDK